MNPVWTGLVAPVLLGLTLYLLALLAAAAVARNRSLLAPWVATLLLPALLPPEMLPQSIGPVALPLPAAVTAPLLLLAFAAVYLPLARLDRRLQEMALSLGIPPFRRFRVLLWPAIGPGALLGLALTMGVPLWHAHLDHACWVGSGGALLFWLLTVGVLAFGLRGRR